jgi:hypothetical protein
LFVFVFKGRIIRYGNYPTSQPYSAYDTYEQSGAVGGGAETYQDTFQPQYTEDLPPMPTENYLGDELPPPPPQDDWQTEANMTTEQGQQGLVMETKKSLEIFAHFEQGRCRVLFEYEAQRDDELTLQVGEELTILQEDEGWWLGLAYDGRQGLFPR